VDSLVRQQVAVVQGKVEELQTQALGRLPLEKAQLDDVQKKLESELKRLAGSAAGGLKLPKL
jgi:predicted nuclease with TOPRIM domain